MKLSYMVLAAALLISGTAQAVSIDFPVYTAKSVSNLETVASEDGTTSSTSIEFKGSGLKGFMRSLPQVKNERGELVKGLRMLRITNAGERGVADDEATSIYIKCEVETGAR